MPEIRTLATLPDGTVLRGYEVDFETVKENWNEYLLAGDVRLRAKHTVLKAFLLVNENGEPLADDLGEPQVFINGSMSLVASRVKGE